MTDELRLPPHIEIRQGLYWNTLSGRWVGNHSIRAVCDDYWALEEAQGYSATMATKSGTTAFKNPAKVDRRRREFKKKKEVEEFSEFDIPPNPHAGEEFSDEIFEKPEEQNFEVQDGEPFEKDTVNRSILDDKQRLIDQFDGLKKDFEKLQETASTPARDDHGAKSEFTSTETASENIIDTDSLMTIKSAAKRLNHSPAYIYKLLQKGSLDEVIVDGIKFVTVESVERRRTEYDEQNNRIKKERAESASLAARDKKMVKAIDPVEIIKPFVEIVERNTDGRKSDAEMFFESPIYQNSVSFLFNIESHDGLVQILSDICKERFEVDFEYMRFKVRCETIPCDKTVWYEEIMAMICAALWSKLPVANRVDWLSSFLNRTPIQIAALLGIHWREMETSRGNWYNHKDGDSNWLEAFLEVSHPLDDYFLPFYRFDYTYKYCEKKK